MDWSLLFDHRCQIPCNCSQTPTTSKIFEMVERLLQPVPMFLNAIFPMFDFRFPKTLWFLGISSMVLALATFLTQRFMAFIATWKSYLHTATSALSTNFWHRFFACDSIARSPSSFFAWADGAAFISCSFLHLLQVTLCNSRHLNNNNTAKILGNMYCSYAYFYTFLVWQIFWNSNSTKKL